MTKETVSDNLHNFYIHLQKQIAKGNHELVLDEIFELDVLKSLTSEISEDAYRDFFILNIDDPKPQKLFSYQDEYDFINSLTRYEIDDLMIFCEEDDIMELAIGLITILNKGFNDWLQNKNAAFRKGSRLYFEMDTKGIHLYFKTQLKT